MKSSTHQSTLHLSFKIKCCVDRLRPPCHYEPGPGVSGCVAGADKSRFANYSSRIARDICEKNQRLQASARATTATNSSPINRIMMMPIPGGELRNGIGSVLLGRMLFMKICPPGRFAAV